VNGVFPCPACGSHNTHRSRLKGKWESWRQRVTGKRPYRCRVCHWRGWGVDRGGRRIVGEADEREPPSLDSISLPGRDLAPDVDLAALDAIAFAVEERMKPLAAPRRI
jgi:hypothetical protein